LTITAGARGADPSKIAIEGERVAENVRHFRWTVTNNGKAPIIRFRAPSYLSSETIPPEGWTGIPPKGGAPGEREFEFVADSNRHAIRTGQTLSFEVHDRRLRGTTKRRSVTIELLGGEVLTIDDVWCPAPESFVERNVPLIGLTTMFAIFLLVQALRKKRKDAKSGETPASQDEASS